MAQFILFVLLLPTIQFSSSNKQCTAYTRCDSFLALLVELQY